MADGGKRSVARTARYALMGVCWVLTALFLVAAAVLNRLTHTRMGMARHMVYLRSKWSDALPVEVLRVVAVLAAVVLAVAIAVWFVRRAAWRSPATAFSFAVMVVLVCLYAGYTLGVDPQTARAHIVVSPLLGLAALVQEANIALACLVWVRLHGRAAG